VQPDGAGTIDTSVLVDAAATEELNSTGQIVTSDLDGTSWEVTRTDNPDGSILFEASHRFANTAEASEIFQEIGGAGIPAELIIERSQQPGEDRYSVTASADLSGGSVALADSELIELLGDDFALEEAASGDVTVSIQAQLPGDEASEPISGLLGQPAPLELAGQSIIQRPEPGQARLEAASQQSDSDHARSLAIGLGIAGVLAALAMVVALWSSRRRSDGPSQGL